MSAIKWHCVKTGDNYSIRAEKTAAIGIYRKEYLISMVEWRYLHCQRYALESIIHRMTRAIEEATK